MKIMHFSINISAPKEKVWRAMLEQEGYKAWTSEFGAGSYYEGSWDKGQRIRFLGPGNGGMISMIAENKPYEFVSIKHLGFIKDGVEDTDSAEVKAWAPSFENYSFSEKNGVTEVRVDVDELPEMEEFMATTWPKALEQLKRICEGSASAGSEFSERPGRHGKRQVVDV